MIDRVKVLLVAELKHALKESGIPYKSNGLSVELLKNGQKLMTVWPDNDGSFNLRKLDYSRIKSKCDIINVINTYNQEIRR